MAHRQQQLIDRILGDEGEANDHTLRGQAMERAENGQPPKTLTPWEWLEWYETHGVPESHNSPEETPGKPWWRFWG